jgi:hypothetical protein
VKLDCAASAPFFASKILPVTGVLPSRATLDVSTIQSSPRRIGLTGATKNGSNSRKYRKSHRLKSLQEDWIKLT